MAENKANIVIFQGKRKKHKAYRTKVQQYAKEEEKIWEDFRHGMIIGTKDFVHKIRSKYLPEKPHKEIPQHRNLAKSIDPVNLLENAAQILNCDMDYIRNAQRISKQKKEDRDLLVYLVWKNCVLTNEEIGRLFGMSYSAISHIISSMKTRLQQNPDLQNKYKHLYSLCKI